MPPIMTDIPSFDTHAREKPPETMRLLFRRLQKAAHPSDASTYDIFDFEALSDQQRRDLQVHPVDQSLIHPAFSDFLAESLTDYARTLRVQQPLPAPQMIEFRALPGLVIMPNLFPPSSQIALLNKLLHRDLSNPAHKTNLHFHHQVPYTVAASNVVDSEDRLSSNKSFFSLDPETRFTPRDSSSHQPLSLRMVLEKRLRWITLGGQYDWTNKVYPAERPPPFPEDIRKLLRELFPDISAQAAIVNLYSPGDTLSVHRDVSERCDQGLISVSIGCDAVFIVSIEGNTDPVALRLHSGDALLMSGPARFAWHAVPKIEPNTCPEWLQDWPANPDTEECYNQYRGWMRKKRINLNVRQITNELGA